MTKEQRELVENNINLLWSFMNKFHLDKSTSTEDWFGRLSVALCEAAIGFDKTKGYQFSTYAYRYMLTQLRSGNRKTINKEKNEISIDTLKLHNGGEVVVDDTKIMYDTSKYGNGEEETENKEFLCNFNSILATLKTEQQGIIYERIILDKNIVDVAKKYNISKQRVSQLCKTFCKRYARKYKIVNHREEVM